MERGGQSQCFGAEASDLRTDRWGLLAALSKLTLTHPSRYLGAVVASPTFSLPEYIGGTRNW